MSDQSKEATLREVLSEVSLADLGDLLKSLSFSIGCIGLFVAVGFAFVTGASFAGFETNWNIPDWVIWLLGLWIFFGAYTENQSYHEHIFRIYMPKLGWVFSIPIALWFFIGVQLFLEIDYKSSFSSRIFTSGIWLVWFIPTTVSFSALEIGHRNLMEKRRISNGSDPLG